MLVGPMKKKVVMTGIICTLVPIILLGVLGFFMFQKFNGEIAELKAQQPDSKRYVLAKDVMPNHVITNDDLKLADVMEIYAPADSFIYKETVVNGKKNIVDEKYSIIGRRLKTGGLENTIITDSLFYEDDKEPTIDLRLQEFNMITLPSDLVENDYIDVRVRFPSGEDYSVLVGKRIERYSNNTIFIRLTEDEILTIGSAIVEAYIIDGTNLYANKYVDPANQLFEYAKVDYVAKYEDALSTLKEEIIQQRIAEYMNENVGISEEEARDSVKGIGNSEITDEQIANRIGLARSEVSELRKAIDERDEEVIAMYREKDVTFDKKIAMTYPVKESVLNLIMANPNILEEVKANFNTDAIIAQRLNMPDTSINEFNENSDKVKEKLAEEIQTQREERVQYLKKLIQSES